MAALLACKCLCLASYLLHVSAGLMSAPTRTRLDGFLDPSASVTISLLGLDDTDLLYLEALLSYLGAQQ